MARRTATNTVFAALHEPFTGGTESRRVGAFTRLAQNERGLAAAVTGVDGSEINDRILLAYGDDIEQPLTLAGGDESFTFSDCVHVRIGRDRVTVTGPIQAMDIPVSGTPVLMLDGEKAGDAVVEGGRLQWQRRP
jgi:hypothetical protein